MTMSEEEALYKRYKKAASAIINAGPMPFPISETFIEILKLYLDEDDLDFVKAFKTRRNNQTIAQIIAIIIIFRRFKPKLFFNALKKEIFFPDSIC